ncbi:MAG TPA: DUF4197 domain-containing protein [Casimicrobiaceae bacterium]|nr:DUF4197 domain-containing protein [Casimicrobiaceae bacterium]
MRTPMRIAILAVAAALIAGSAAAQLPDIKSLLGSAPKTAISEDKAAVGLKDALRVGAGNAVSLAGRTDGYFGNDAIRIGMPDKLRFVEKGLRAVGYGPQVDAFVLSMNRAAEKAAPAAKDIFVGAIQQMTFDDARKILSGGDTAATEYFRAKTSDKLTTAFRPIVGKSMEESGVTKRYSDLLGQYKSIPFAGSVSFDLDDYVVAKALDGLFYMIAQQEKSIRTDPAARVTAPLKEVFGSVRLD